MKNLFHKFKPQIKTALSILSVVAIGFSAIMAGVTINTKSVKADYEDATISPDGSYPAFNVNGVGYNTLFYKDEYDQVVYCTEHDYSGPTAATSYRYSSSQPSLSSTAQRGLKCILSYGYIGLGNEPVITEFGLSKEQARAATQTAIHMYLCELKEVGSGYSYNYAGQFSKRDGEEATWDATQWLISKATDNIENKSTADITVNSLGGEREGLYYVARFEASDDDFSYIVTGLADDTYTSEKNGNIITVKALFKANMGNSIKVNVFSNKTAKSYNIGYYISQNGIKQTMVGGIVKQKAPEDEASQPVAGTYDEYGWLKVEKTDADTGESLTDAVFYVYKTADCSGDPIAVLTTGRTYTTLDNNYVETNGIGQIPVDTGTYYVKEVAAPYGYYLSNEVKQAVITYNSVTTVSFTNKKIENKPFSIVKRSADDGDKVVGATYSLYDITEAYTGDADSFGEWLFNTAAEIRSGRVTEYGFIQSATTDGNGVASFDVSLMADKTSHTIMMLETSAPAGYQLDPDIYTLYSTNNEWIVASDYEIKNTVSDRFAPGKIQIKKTDENGNVLSGAVFGVYTDKECKHIAKTVGGYEENGYCYIDNNGDYIYEDDVYLTTDANGTATTGYLPAGTYYIKEIEVPSGYNLSTDIKSVYAGHNIPMASISYTDTAITGTIEIHKTDSINRVSVEGAVYGLYSNGQLYKTFPATNEYGYSKLSGLPLGTYSVKEVQAPAGYELSDVSTDVNIKVTSSNNELSFCALVEVEDQPVINSDMITVNVSKTDQFGNFVKDATLQLVDSDDHVVDEWKTDGTVHKFSKEKSGVGEAGYFSEKERTYTLKEKVTPNGYITAEPITFTIDETTKTANIKMIDVTGTGIYVEKVDQNGNGVKGATLQLKNKFGDVVEEWISDGTVHKFDYESYLRKVKKTDDLSKVTITDDDLTFTLHEEKNPENYLTADDISFNVSKETYTAVVKMIDVLKAAKVYVIKVSEDGNALAGAKLQVIDEAGNICDEWVSDGGKHIVTGVELGKTYTLHEAEAPFGYEYAEDVKFTLPNDSKDMEVVMTDKKKKDVKTCKIYVQKEDEYGTPLEGAVLGLFDMDGNEIYRWTSTKEAYVIDNLAIGEAYMIKEISAPLGYEFAENISFTTTEEDATIHMIDKLMTDSSQTSEIIQTGDNGNVIKLIVYGCIMILGICGIIVSIAWKREN